MWHFLDDSVTFSMFLVERSCENFSKDSILVEVSVDTFSSMDFPKNNYSTLPPILCSHRCRPWRSVIWNILYDGINVLRYWVKRIPNTFLKDGLLVEWYLVEGSTYPSNCEGWPSCWVVSSGRVDLSFKLYLVYWSSNISFSVFVLSLKGVQYKGWSILPPS